MINILGALIVSCLTTFLSIKVIKPFAKNIGLVDIPNARKAHIGEIPLIGGISVFVGVLVATSLYLPESQMINLYLISSAMLVFIGVLDDKFDLNVSFRVVAQSLIAMLMVFGANIYLSDFGDILGFGDIKLGALGFIITIVAVIAAINAFNMIDGIDGLSGTMGIISVLSIASLYLLAGQTDYIALPLVIAASLLPFLFYNLSGFSKERRYRKIFMGDAGSMFMGFTIVWLLVMGTQGEGASFRAVTGLWIIGIPLMDLCSIVLRRLKKGQSPFVADRDHLHHIFLRMGFTVKETLLIISLLALFLAGIGILGELFRISEVTMFLSFLLTFFAYNSALQHSWKFTKWVKKIKGNANEV
ncbi:UDP-N-acetylglucosamine--undecaprenyl-phosphate N-acetylglucosaminephosphotransferase [Alteromonadaceae bacterium BrNp21-10]|nr:UDP-N-acetylglucosamine--undecaprenyl-phosphate N-acetylglucosaminephosphotransferase [Alteromonadaceae bacterium BrNp21-10]